MRKTAIERFLQLLWRPRPPSVVASKEVRMSSLALILLFICMHNCKQKESLFLDTLNVF